MPIWAVDVLHLLEMTYKEMRKLKGLLVLEYFTFWNGWIVNACMLTPLIKMVYIVNITPDLHKQFSTLSASI